MVFLQEFLFLVIYILETNSKDSPFPNLLCCLYFLLEIGPFASSPCGSFIHAEIQQQGRLWGRGKVWRELVLTKQRPSWKKFPFGLQEELHIVSCNLHPKAIKISQLFIVEFFFFLWEKKLFVLSQVFWLSFGCDQLLLHQFLKCLNLTAYKTYYGMHKNIRSRLLVTLMMH